jgi:NADH:ubiquinone oxidoreductase subunit E
MDTKGLEPIFSRYEGEVSDLIPVLQDIQDEFRYLPKDALVVVSERLNVPLTQIFSVAICSSPWIRWPAWVHAPKRR